jgi:hypothetical protein
MLLEQARDLVGRQRRSIGRHLCSSAFLAQTLEAPPDCAVHDRDRSSGELRNGESHGDADDSHLGWWQTNRAENSHQPVRRREGSLQRFKSGGRSAWRSGSTM